jgi:outer membrane protein assembly factor BamB
MLAASLSWRTVYGQFITPGISDEEVNYTVELNEVAAVTRRELERAEAFLKNQQWEEAVETFRRIIEEDSDRVIAVDYGSAPVQPSSSVHIPVREFCQMRLARQAIEAPEALKLYRQRVDPVVRELLNRAKPIRDIATLRRVIRTMFASSHGDDALFVLGEIELERGNFASARGLWERISPSLRTPQERNTLLASPPGQPLWLALHGVDVVTNWNELAPALEHRVGAGSWYVYPDTDLDLADVRARLVLVSILEGSHERAEIELSIFERLHPGAEGVIAGKTGHYSELLTLLCRQSNAWTDKKPNSAWPTFAGSQSRTRQADREVDVGGRVLWTYAFEKTFHYANEPQDESGFPRNVFNSPERSLTRSPILSYHPVVVDDTVFFNDSQHVFALDLFTGEPAAPADISSRQAGVVYVPPAQEAAAAVDLAFGNRDLGAPRFTLNVQNKQLFARVGSAVTGELAETPGWRQQGYLVTLDLKAGFKQLHDPIKPDGPEWAFEGAPVSDGSRLYVAMRQSEIRAVSYVVCFDLHTGEQLWRRKICSAETTGHGQRREITHNLLTLAEGSLYYNSNLGAIAALSVPDGEIQWVTRYRRVSRRRTDERQDPRFLRDLNPCVFHKGMLITFPTDGNQVFAIDSMSGQLLWATPEDSTPDVAHLLGITKDDRLVLSGAYLYWLDANSGRFLAQFPENAYFAEGRSLPNPHGMGRGILAGDMIYWPTQTNTAGGTETQETEIQLLRQRLERTERAWQAVRVREIDLSAQVGEIPVRGANLTVSNGVLILATPQHLIALGE